MLLLLLLMLLQSLSGLILLGPFVAALQHSWPGLECCTHCFEASVCVLHQEFEMGLTVRSSSGEHCDQGETVTQLLSGKPQVQCVVVQAQANF